MSRLPVRPFKKVPKNMEELKDGIESVLNDLILLGGIKFSKKEKYYSEMLEDYKKIYPNLYLNTATEKSPPEVKISFDDFIKKSKILRFSNRAIKKQLDDLANDIPKIDLSHQFITEEERSKHIRDAFGVFICSQISYYIQNNKIDAAKQCYELLTKLHDLYNDQKLEGQEFKKQRLKIVIEFLRGESEIPDDEKRYFENAINEYFGKYEERSKVNKDFITNEITKDLFRNSRNTEIAGIMELVERNLEDNVKNNLILSSIYDNLALVEPESYLPKSLSCLKKANDHYQQQPQPHIGYKQEILRANSVAAIKIARAEGDYQEYLEFIQRVEQPDSQELQKFLAHINSIEESKNISKAFLLTELEDQALMQEAHTESATLEHDAKPELTSIIDQHKQQTGNTNLLTLGDQDEQELTSLIYQDQQATHTDPLALAPSNLNQIDEVLSPAELSFIGSKISISSDPESIESIRPLTPPNAFEINGEVYMLDSPDVVELRKGLYAAIDKSQYLDLILQKQLQQSLAKGFANSNTGNGVKTTHVSKGGEKKVGYYIKHGTVRLRLQAPCQYHDKERGITIIIFRKKVSHTKDDKDIREGTFFTETVEYIDPSRPYYDLERGGAAISGAPQITKGGAAAISTGGGGAQRSWKDRTKKKEKDRTEGERGK